MSLSDVSSCRPRDPSHHLNAIHKRVCEMNAPLMSSDSDS